LPGNLKEIVYRHGRRIVLRRDPVRQGPEQAGSAGTCHQARHFQDPAACGVCHFIVQKKARTHAQHAAPSRRGQDGPTFYAFSAALQQSPASAPCCGPEAQRPGHLHDRAALRR
jgi:hypothetical protein